MRSDHLGSIVTLADESGVVAERRSYDAWGRERNLGDWSNYTVSATGLLDRGYTGHEHLKSFGLINMNARLYDPLLGRFLNPDPYVQAPLFSQNFNRYSYCLNNPLIYTDPDGEWIHLVIGAFIGGTVNLIANFDKIEKPWQGLAYFGVGAVAGALGAGVGAGISSMLPVAGTASGGFAAGFLGTSAATTATSSFVSGALIGGGAGLTSGFTSGLGNGLLGDQNFGQALWSGTKNGLIGGLSGAAIGGLWSGIDAAIDGRRFWDGATVTKEYAVDIPDLHKVKQVGKNNCLPASGESVDRMMGGNLTQDQIRKFPGFPPDPENDPIRNSLFWNTYGSKTSHTIEGLPDYAGLGKIVPTMSDGGMVSISLPGSEGVGHAVVIKSVYLQTVTKVNGQITRTIMYKIMDPGSGSFRTISLDGLRGSNIWLIGR